jgi:hypothetical protein
MCYNILEHMIALESSFGLYLYAFREGVKREY